MLDGLGDGGEDREVLLQHVEPSLAGLWCPTVSTSTSSSSNPSRPLPRISVLGSSGSAEVVERLASAFGAVVERDPSGQPLLEDRSGGGDADPARPDDPDAQPGHARPAVTRLPSGR